MPSGPRPLPGRPSLRYLKLEAKRRLVAGEFPSLHEAQAALAREHGLPSWAALKQLIGGQRADLPPKVLAAAAGDGRPPGPLPTAQGAGIPAVLARMVPASGEAAGRVPVPGRAAGRRAGRLWEGL
jgi:hypothetical protein